MLNYCISKLLFLDRLILPGFTLKVKLIFYKLYIRSISKNNKN
jgi:hypothetical protein